MNEQFEIWAKQEKLNLAYGDCGYVYSSTEAAWKAWQAASKASEQQLAAVVAENAGLKTYRPQPHGAAMMEALDAFYADEADEDVPEKAMLSAYNILRGDIETPATDAYLAEVRAQARNEGAHFVANRMLAAWDAGFIEDTAKNAADIARMILTSTEFMRDAPEGDFDRSFADGVLKEIAASLRQGAAL
ncbi:MAG: Eae-like protein [Kluyvera sp.]|uniref:Eae-like protein n=1 Tax=Kluyvera sp. TaxID=1538228 RepID=UPI003F2BCE3E